MLGWSSTLQYAVLLLAFVFFARRSVTRYLNTDLVNVVRTGDFEGQFPAITFCVLALNWEGQREKNVTLDEITAALRSVKERWDQ